ncbi:MAG TPA: DNA polymerase III subunit beta [Armatimonadota bacterium]
MKVLCERKALAEAVSVAGRAVPGRTALPIQSHFLITAEDGSLKLAGADYELQVEKQIGAQVIEEGQCTVVARVFQDIVGSLPDSDIELESQPDGKVFLKCRSSQYELLGLPAEEFPPLPHISSEVGLSVTGATLKTLVRHTTFAVSDDASRPQLTGINVLGSESSLKFAATDGSRLVVRRVELEAPLRGEINCIVPARALNEVARVLADDQVMEVSVTPNQVLFRLPTVSIVSRLIEGQFPNFERVIPKEYTKKVTAPAPELHAASRRCMILAEENQRLILQLQGDQLHLKAESGKYGRGHEQVEVVREGEDIEIAFNARFLNDFLAVVSSEGVDIEMTAPLSPGVFRPTETDGFTYVLMPMHLM